MDMPKIRPKPIRTKGKDVDSKLLAWITSIREWEIVEDWKFGLPRGEKIVIPKGFVFDGASIPRILWAILSPTGLLLIQGLIHDYGYRYDYIWIYDSNGVAYKGHKNAGQDYWDNFFYEVGYEVNGIRALNRLAWVALTLFGKFAWEKNCKKRPKEPKLYPEGPIRPEDDNRYSNQNRNFIQC